MPKFEITGGYDLCEGMNIFDAIRESSQIIAELLFPECANLMEEIEKRGGVTALAGISIEKNGNISVHLNGARGKINSYKCSI
jgi:hypothetical protein